MMRKSLYIIILSVAFSSCASQKKVSDSTIKKASAPAPKPVAPAPAKVSVQKCGNADFYTTNIGDITKNDNTISYGSIVTAKPAGFNVVKTYFPAVAQNFRQRYIILHYTALTGDKSITVLTQQEVSAHYLVNNLPDSEIYQLVDENKRAYHAGISHWRKDNNLNDNSIGIEIVNLGNTTEASGGKTFDPFPDFQIKKVAALVKDIATRYNIPATNIIGHSEVAPLRKPDPGAAFPWKQLYDEYNIGMWYDEATKNNFLAQSSSEEFNIKFATPQFIFQVQNALRDFGFDITPSGIWDKNSMRIVEVFQYHFRPQNSDGKMDAETWAILQALNLKYPSK